LLRARGEQVDYRFKQRGPARLEQSDQRHKKERDRE
jgi:hypothetical protein